jgi:hypothetical protein
MILSLAMHTVLTQLDSLLGKQTFSAVAGQVGQGAP